MNKNALKKRWKKFQTTEEILSETKNLQVSPFGKTEANLQDFRGLTLWTSELSSGGGWHNEPHSINLRQSDFSFSTWKGFDISESIITDSRFEGAELIGDIRFYSTKIENCLFENCLFKNVNFTKSSLINVSFFGLRPRDKFSFSADRIERFRFEGEMKGVNFSASPLKESAFAGTLTDCTFLGNLTIITLDKAREIYGRLEAENVANRMQSVDFEAANLIRCNFSNYCYLDKITPPPQDKNCIVKITPEFFAEAAHTLKRHCDPRVLNNSIMWLETFYRPDPRVPYGVSSPQDLEKPLGISGAALFYKAFLEAAINTATKV